MLTPQQIRQASFEKALFGGYDMDSVNDFLEPLTKDYVTLYKENSILKSKMRILVEKLEEYRKQEASMQSAILAAQKTCDQMVADAEKKCAKMLHEAQENANAKSKNVDLLVEDEQERLDAAKRATAQYLDTAEESLKKQLALLAKLREETPVKQPEPERVHQFAPPTEPPLPTAPAKDNRAFDFDAEDFNAEDKADAIIDEIGQSIEARMAPPVSRATGPDINATRRFESLSPEKQKKFEDLQFGKNYDPKKW